jgi:hypothetical protein
MATFLLGVLAGIAGTLTVVCFFAFGPEKLRDNILISIGFLIRNLMPFGVMRHMELKISPGRVKVNETHRYINRFNDRQEMIIDDMDAKYSFSFLHVLPSFLVLSLARRSSGASFNRKAVLAYGANTSYQGNLLKIDRNISIFTLDKDSYNQRLDQWNRRPKPPRKILPNLRFSS